MTQKERVTGLFEFLMDLLDEKTSKPVEQTKSELNSEPIKVLQNPTLPHHPSLNPYINSNDGKPSWVDGSLELMNKISAIDKERAEERNKVRIADNATRPLINKLRELKEQGHKNALEVKENEELETIVGEVGDKLGITLENGKIKLVNVHKELRDNIPLDEFDDLPKHIIDKLDTSTNEAPVYSSEPMSRKQVTKKPLVKTKTPTKIANNRTKK